MNLRGWYGSCPATPSARMVARSFASPECDGSMDDTSCKAKRVSL